MAALGLEEDAGLATQKTSPIALSELVAGVFCLLAKHMGALRARVSASHMCCIVAAVHLDPRIVQLCVVHRRLCLHRKDLFISATTLHDILTHLSKRMLTCDHERQPKS